MITMGLFIAAGCSNNANSEGTEEGPIEIEFWYGLGGKLGEGVEKTISDFNESQDEIKVVGVAQGEYEETVQKLQAAVAAKKVPAAVLLQNDPMNAFAKKGVLAPMDSFINEDSDFKKEDFVSAFYQQGTIEGKQYAIPLYGTTQVMYYRKDLFEKYGLTTDVFDSWESLAEAAKVIKDQEGVYGWEPMYGPDNLIDMALSNGAQYISEDGKTVMIDSPEWVEAWEFIRTLIHEEKTMAIHHGGQGWEYWYKTIDDVMQGNAAGYTGSSGDQGDLDFDIVSAHPQPGWKDHDPAPHAGAMVASIPALASDKEQEAAYEWITYFSSAEKTAEWSMNTGYIPVRKSAQEVEAYKEFAEKNPQSNVPLTQAQYATPPFVDPTGGKIYDALEKAADKVEIQGISASEALKEAKEEAQRALDNTLN
ncbi:ABC transporter substrate-binding protein [Cytobacillus gottheilii]|uniref:ABC transporter substrate-binding protein n=1 Tax=Cytobacillus gottheilii TaxID=859144 RepID=UPI0035A2A139